MDGHDASGVAAGETRGRRQRPVVEREGLPRREGTGGGLRGADEIAEGALPVLGRGVVPGQRTRDLAESIAVERLQRLSDPSVERPPLGRGDRRVRHLVGEGVLERVGHLGEQTLLVDQLHRA